MNTPHWLSSVHRTCSITLPFHLSSSHCFPSSHVSPASVTPFPQIASFEDEDDEDDDEDDWDELEIFRIGEEDETALGGEDAGLEDDDGTASGGDEIEMLPYMKSKTLASLLTPLPAVVSATMPTTASIATPAMSEWRTRVGLIRERIICLCGDFV